MTVDVQAGKPERAPHASALEDAPAPDAARVEDELLRQPGVAACALLIKPGAEGERRIAYVVPVGAFSRKTLDNRLRESAPGLPLPDAYVPVTTLPLTERGDLDEAALLELPVLDEDVAHALEAELASDPRVEHAAVFVEELPRRPRAIHVTDLAPAEVENLGTRAAPAAPGTASEAASPAPEAPAPAATAVLPLAVFHGPALERHGFVPATLPDALRHAAGSGSGHGITYLGSDGTERAQSLAELLAEARRICKGLQDQGLFPGQYVLLQLANADDVLPAFWGCLLGGFIPAITPIPPSYEAGTNELERLCHVIELLERPPLVMREALKPQVAPLRERLALGSEKLIALEALRSAPEDPAQPAQNAEDVAFLVFTSGSTGAPKIIQLSHRNILTRSSGTNRLCSHETSDRILNWLPFDHIGSISDWHLRCVDLGCHMVYCAKEYVLGDPLNWLRLIDRFRITHSWAPNFAYALVNEALKRTEERFDLASMKALLTAGEAVSSNTVQEFLERLAPHGLAATALRPAFGMAELGSGVTYFLPTPERPVRVRHVDRARLEGALRPVEPDDPSAIGFTSLGPVIPGAGMRIVDEHNNVLPELTIGRLQICGGPVCQGYFKNPEANREVFVGDGWFNTGDRGFCADGELYLTGRDKESLIINGANYSNSEIEAAVEDVEGILVSFVAACAVRPAGDPEERLAIFFSPRDAGRDLALSQLLRKVQNGITRKTGVKPDYLLPVTPETIPKTAIGKIQRKQLVKRFESGEFAALLKRVDVLLENERTTPDWFLSPGWRPAALRRDPPARERRYLLLGDRHGLAEQIRRLLEQHGARVTLVAPDEASAGTDRGSAFTDVVRLSGYERVTSGEGSLSAAAAREAARLLEDIGRLAERARHEPAPDRLRYWVVASHSQAVHATDTLDPARAILPALIKAVADELEGVECRHLDLALGTAEDLGARAKSVVAELRTLAPEKDVAFRSGVRFAPCLERVPITARPPALTRGGLYLLTGGLGGVGVELARHLLASWNASLLILGRTPLAAGADETEANRRKREIVAELRELGQVEYRALDIGDAGALESAVAQLEVRAGRRLDGAFHLASVYHERPLTDETEASLAAMLAPKLDGAVALHALLKGRPEAFVLCFSSVVSVFGAPGFAAYAAANRSLDAYCHEQRNREKSRSYCVDWSVWDGLGIASEGAAEEILKRLGPGVTSADVRARLVEAERSRGYLRIGAAQGMRSLGAVLSLPPCQLVVGVDVVHPSMQSITVGRAEPLLGIRGVYTLRAGTAGEARPLPASALAARLGPGVDCELRLLAKPPLTVDGRLDREAVLLDLRGAARKILPPTTPLHQELVAIWKDVLGVEKLGINESFFDLGGTSLLSVRLFAEIERKLGVSLQLSTLFQAATIEALAALLEARPAAGPAETLAPLVASDAERTLFLIHDADGDVARYRELAHLLAADVRVYALAPFAKDRFPALHTSVEEMAAYHVAKIRSVAPAGPYALGGAGAGGVIAFEIACRLQAAGERVTLVALLDAHDAALRPKRPRGAGQLDNGRPAPSNGSQTGPLDRLKLAVEQRMASLTKRAFDQARVRLLHRLNARGSALPWYLQHIPAEVVVDFARSGYRPGRFDGKLTLFLASGAAPGAGSDDLPARERCRDELLGWSPRATAGVEVVRVAGGHLSMLREPAVTDLAARLKSALGSR